MKQVIYGEDPDRDRIWPLGGRRIEDCDYQHRLIIFGSGLVWFGEWDESEAFMNAYMPWNDPITSDGPSIRDRDAL